MAREEEKKEGPPDRSLSLSLSREQVHQAQGISAVGEGAAAGRFLSLQSLHSPQALAHLVKSDVHSFKTVFY